MMCKLRTESRTHFGTTRQQKSKPNSVLALPPIATARRPAGSGAETDPYSSYSSGEPVRTE